MTVDAHQHFWDPALGTYAWMTDELAAIRRPFLPSDLQPELAAHDIERTIAVQARADGDETRWLLQHAHDNEFIGGVVGWVDLTSDDVAAQIESLRAGTGGGKLVGIRHPAHDEPDPEWLVQPSVVDGVAIVADEGLVFDLLVRTRELPAAWRLARLSPHVTFVIDHLAKPGPAPEPAWSEWMHRLATLPNVAVKLSGLVTEGSWTEWQPDDFAAQTSFVLEEFGPDRLLYGSDWPVCRLAASYAEVMELAVGLLRGTDEDERRLIFGENATRIYDLRAA